MTVPHPKNRISPTYMHTSPAMHVRSAIQAQLFTETWANLATLLRVRHGSGIERGQRRDMMARAKLDRIDRRILSDLQANGRMTNVELAERAGISAPPCLRRGGALGGAGPIKGDPAGLRPPGAGVSGSGVALGGLDNPAGTDPKAFAG